MTADRTLEAVLMSTSDVLFPAELGEKRVEVNSHDCMGDTPLHVMAWRSDVEGARMLLEAGAKIDAIGDMSETPLHVAIGQECSELVALLITAGANLDIRSEFGKTAREKARAQGFRLPYSRGPTRRPRT